MRKALLLFMLFPLVALGSILPAGRMGTWTNNVGLEGGIPNSSNMTVFATIAAGASAATIQSSLDTCPSNQVVQLSSGTYNLSSGLTITHDGVVLRGAGISNTVLAFTAGTIFVGNQNTFSAIHDNNYVGGGTANWTAGYSQGESNLTFSTTATLAVGSLVCLDQNNAAYYVNNTGYEGLNNAGRTNGTRIMIQISRVTAINGSTVTIWPPLQSPLWSGSLSPAAWWVSPWQYKVGVENLSIDANAATGSGTYASCIAFETSANCWTKNIKTISAPSTHIETWGGFRNEFRHCIMWKTKAGAQLSYGALPNLSSFCLVEDNVGDDVTASLIFGFGCTANVFGYNYITNNHIAGTTSWLHPAFFSHDAHTTMNLFEGNYCGSIDADFVHGSGSHGTIFRNRFEGWQPYTIPSGPTLNNLYCIYIDITNRAWSSVGNVLGHQSVYTHYQAVPGSNPGDHSIYAIGLVNNGYGLGWPDDNETYLSSFRHMDYDTVTGAITYNSTNADVTLPNSLYYGSRPSFFGNMTWPPWNPTNGAAIVAQDVNTATNIPAGFRYFFGVETPAGDPIISGQPQNATACANNTATFTVTASGNTALSYQWNWHGTNVSGATASSWTTPTLVSADGVSSVFVTVTDTAGSLQSSTVTLTVTADPLISVQPQNTTVSVGQTATFSVTASSCNASVLSYQWNWFGTNVTGATSSSWTTPVLTLNQSGSSVFVAVTDTAGTLNSSTVILTVTTGGTPFTMTIGQGSGAAVGTIKIGDPTGTAAKGTITISK